MDICVLGSANLDHVLLVHHIPRPGETLEAKESLLMFGGKVRVLNFGWWFWIRNAYFNIFESNLKILFYSLKFIKINKISLIYSLIHKLKLPLIH